MEHKRTPKDVVEHQTIIGHEFCGKILEVGSKWKDKLYITGIGEGGHEVK